LKGFTKHFYAFLSQERARLLMRIITRFTFVRVFAGIALCAAALLCGCSNGNARTVVTSAPTSQTRFATLKIVEDRAGATVPDDARTKFRQKLDKRFYGGGLFARGDELTLRYNFMEFEPGSQLGRLLLGVTNADSEANMTVQVIYLGADGKELSKVQVSSRLTGGVLSLGGFLDQAMDRAADKVREFTEANFARGQ
jgi:hypothetical protein